MFRSYQIVVLQEEEKVQRVAACKSIDEFLGKIASIAYDRIVALAWAYEHLRNA